MARGSFSNTTKRIYLPDTPTRGLGVTQEVPAQAYNSTVSRAALQQALVFHYNLSHRIAAGLCGVSKKTIWMSVSSGMGGRKPWMSRTEEERQAAIEEAGKLIELWNQIGKENAKEFGGEGNGTR